MQCMSVDLPDPDGPMTAVNLACSNTTLTAASARTAACPVPYVFCRFTASAACAVATVAMPQASSRLASPGQATDIRPVSGPIRRMRAAADRRSGSADRWILWITCAQLVASMWTRQSPQGIPHCTTRPVLWTTRCDAAKPQDRVLLSRLTWRSSSARQSKRLIIAVSPVQVRSPLQEPCSEGAALLPGSRYLPGGATPRTPRCGLRPLPGPPGAGLAYFRVRKAGVVSPVTLIDLAFL
jgi:hypothetical protein